VLRAFKLSPFVICTSVSLLVIGELALGASLYYTAMMAIAMLSIGITYNLLDGVATFGGMLFTIFALCTLVISQFAKVLLFESPEKHLEAPLLTISVYAVFFLSAMVGVLLFGKVRLRLPKPIESLTGSQGTLLYTIAVVVGLTGTILFEFYNGAYSSQGEFTRGRTAGLAFAPLLLFALVIAVDTRIKETDGQHSFSLTVLIPLLAMILFGFFDTSRGSMLKPVVVYFIACHLRGYRFKWRHYMTFGLGIVAFFYFIGPLALYTRSFISNQPLKQRIYWAVHILATHHDPTELRNASDQATTEGSGLEQYYDRPGTNQLSRLSLIRADSDLISACSNGYHYGFEAIKIGIVQNIPSFLYKNKPRDSTAADFLGRISGVSGDSEGITQPTLSAVADSYGAFGWIGVILVPFFGFPMVFIIYESMFDFSRPWGTVALGICLLTFAETSMLGLLHLILRTPLDVLLLSYLVVGLVKMVPMRGDRALGWGA
jgi:hypothetical protein